MNQAREKSQDFKKAAECLYRNGNRVYFARVKVNGKQIRRSLDTTDLAIAKRRLVEFRAKAERLEGDENRNIRFEELADEWLASIKSGLKPKSYDRRRVALVGLTPFFRGMAVKSIGFAEIDAWKRKRGATVSARSHNIELESLKLIFRYACDRGIVLDNPAESFKRRKQPKSMIDLPSRDEFRALVKSLRDAPFAVASGAATMVEFLAYSGMRVGEAREVLFRDVNLSLGSVLITGGELGTKNHQERVIPLFPNLRNLLVRVIEQHPDAGSDARIFEIASPRGAMKLACKRAGLKQFSVHSLRHFFASNAIESGINFKVISEWLGHSDGGILVAKTYGHLRAEYSAAMAEKMSFEAFDDTAPAPCMDREARAA
ncbi:MAG: site-specific integrase [Chthoniobacteraceae bacterium]